ncbi:hypothetical protein P5673_008481, partial [Acropora cervicornis]
MPRDSMMSLQALFVTVAVIPSNVYVHSQGCVVGDIDCNKAVPTVFKLSDSSCPCNDASHSGALKFADDQIYVCNGKKWKMVHLTREVSGPYGSEDNPGLSCDDIYDERIRDGQLEDGIYWLHLNLIGWTMVFKIMSGVRTSPWSVLSSLTTVNELEKEALDITNTDFRQHYKSRIMLLWESFNPAQA